jgi:hypothetical protein
MKHVIALTALLLATPAVAQDDTTGSDKMEDGLQLFLDGLRDELGPTLDNFGAWANQFGPALQDFMTEMGPALADMMDQVQDWSRYETPEILPNGDIIIRRKPDLPPEAEPEKDPDGTDI